MGGMIQYHLSRYVQLINIEYLKGGGHKLLNALRVHE